MNLIASLIVKNELGRYLEPCVGSLLTFCDSVFVIDDRSDDGTWEWLLARAERDNRIRAAYTRAATVFEHEGRARQALLDWTIEAGKPTHILAIDADEFISDGAALRAAIDASPATPVFNLTMEEIWRATPEALSVRTDGGWRPRPVPILYAVQPGRRYHIASRALACGREPISVAKRSGQAPRLGVSVLHFGWSNESARVARHARYAVADNGRFHASKHLASILWPDDQVELVGRAWPAGLEPVRAELVERANRVAVAA